MISKSFLKNTLQIIVIIFILVTSLFSNNYKVFAADINPFLLKQKTSQNQQINSFQGNINISKYTNFVDINKPKISQQQLIRISIRLRDIARFFSPKWPLVIKLNESDAANLIDNEDLLMITDFRMREQDWIPLTVGYGLTLISNELSVLEEFKKDIYIDLLVRNQNSAMERIILDVPLANFCEYLYANIERKKK